MCEPERTEFQANVEANDGSEKNEDKDHVNGNYGSFNHVWICLRFLTAHKRKSRTKS